MNKLPLAKRVQILSMLVEGGPMRTVSRVADVSINTVTKLLIDAGQVCLTMHDELVRDVTALDADTKLMITYFVGNRSGESALILVDDLRDRIASERVQITTEDLPDRSSRCP